MGIPGLFAMPAPGKTSREHRTGAAAQRADRDPQQELDRFGCLHAAGQSRQHTQYTAISVNQFLLVGFGLVIGWATSCKHD